MAIADLGAAEPAPPVRRWRTRGGLVTIGTVLSLITAMGLTLSGLGAADHAVASYDAASWLWSRAKGELARANGVTGRVDTRLPVAGGQAHTVQVSQTDRFVVLRDVNTGQVSSLDLASLRIAATTPTQSGLGVTVALHKDAAFVIDAVQGVVRQLDPRSLVPLGEAVRFPPGITGGTFDDKGRLWIAVPSEGTVTALTAAPLPSQPVATTDGGGISPRRLRTVVVAAPSHDLAISTLEDGVAVLDRTTGALTTVRGDAQRTVPLELPGPGTLPARTVGAAVPVTVPDSRHVFVVDDTGVRRFVVPGTGTRLRPAVAWSGRLYCTDEDTGAVHVFDQGGNSTGRIDVADAKGPLELEVRENHLFINAPNAATARVVDDAHQVRVVDKYANDVLGGDPPPVVAPPPPPPTPKPPQASAPGAPRNVTAAAGNAQARVSWRPAAANGAPITRYVVEGGDKTYQVGADQRSVEITGLTNGQTYRFSVHAVNAKGAGPKRISNPVVPTAEVPDAPASVTAKERPDGTVAVTWPAANGQGLKIQRYAVSTVSAGATAPVGDVTGTELVIKAGELEYGTQYAFSVVAVNERGAGSPASPVSNTVVPFTVPGQPASVAATTVPDARGAVDVRWAPAPDNGRPVTKYVVQAGNTKVDVAEGTATRLTGLGDGADVQVKVHAVNEAGDGPPGTATARTVAAPTVTVTDSTADFDTVTVSFTVDGGGGRPTCTLTLPGKPAVSGSCSRLAVSGLNPSTSYTATVTATNTAGSGTAARVQATAALFGVATCRNGQNGETATYCDKDRPNARNGNEIFSVPRQDNDKQVGWVANGTELKTYCKRQGQDVEAYIYNNNKQSTWWIQVEYKGRNYIPFAWLNLKNGDNINALPNC